MFLKARDEFDLDLRNSVVVGDRDSDMEAGRRAGVKTLLFLPQKYTYTAVGDIRVIGALSEAEKFL
jgi:D-glycero-D-manno-heptose 1,7-bisphosphate phosphatase